MTSRNKQRNVPVPNRNRERAQVAERVEAINARALRAVIKDLLKRLRHNKRQKDLNRKYQKLITTEEYSHVFDTITLPSLLALPKRNKKYHDTYEQEIVRNLTKQPRKPYIAKCAGQQLMLVYIPNFFNETEVSSTTDNLDTLVYNYAPPHGIPKKNWKRDDEGELIDDVTGDYHFCYWKERGMPFKSAILSRDVANGCRKQAASVRYLQTASDNTTKIAQLLRAVDKDYYYKCQQLVRSMPLECNVLRTSEFDPFSGKAILVNKQVLTHRDVSDYPEGWAAMSVYGTFTGGEFCLPDLEIKFSYQPGDLIMFRSYCLNHFIADWTGKYRYATVYFNSASAFEDLNETLDEIASEKDLIEPEKPKKK